MDDEVLTMTERPELVLVLTVILDYIFPSHCNFGNFSLVYFIRFKSLNKIHLPNHNSLTMYGDSVV